MKIKWNNAQLSLLLKIGFDFDVEKDLSSDEYFTLDEKVDDYMMRYGFENDEPNETGLICESIMDKLSEY